MLLLRCSNASLPLRYPKAQPNTNQSATKAHLKALWLQGGSIVTGVFVSVAIV